MLKESTRSQLTDADKACFKSNVTDLITNSQDRGDLILDCDARPEYPLSDVAIESKIDFRSFPSKTIMWINFTNQSITVQRGYQADREVIYPVQTETPTF